MASADYLTREYNEWTRDDVIAAIDDRIREDLGTEHIDGADAYRANYLYVEKGDHWQEGNAWPMTHSDSAVRQAIRDAAELIFCSVDAVEKCVRRQTSGLFGSMPALQITPIEPAGQDGKPSDQQAEEARQMREWLSGWWDRVQLWERMKDAGRRASYAKRGPLRLRFLPSATVTVTRDGEEGPVETTDLADSLTFAEALERIHLSAPLPDAALYYVNEQTQEPACLLTYPSDQGEEEKDVAEIWFRDGDTIVRRILEGEEAREIRLEGARLPLAEVRGPLLLTNSLREQQRRRDYFETILTRIVEAAGFRERYTGNAMPAGIWVRADPGLGNYLTTREDQATGATEYLMPLPRILGSGVLTELQGRELVDADGGRSLATPTVTVVEPVDPEFAIKAAERAQFTILESADQLHIMDGDKAVSGYSKRQSRFAFTQRLQEYRTSAESALAEILTAAIVNALLMTKPGDPAHGFLERYRITVTLKLDTGPLSAEEEEAEMRAAERLFKARSTVQAALGVEDAEAEDQAILSDPIQGLDVMTKRGEVLTAWSTTTNREAALQAAGLDAKSDLGKAARRNDFEEGEQ